MALDDRRARPTLLASCAFAATADETRFRIDRRGPFEVRSARVIALDEGALGLLSGTSVVEQEHARILRARVLFEQAPEGEGQETILRTLGGTSVTLISELADADFVLLVATSNAGAGAAATIGEAAAMRGISVAGFVVDLGATAEAINALRPYARVLLVSHDAGDVSEILTAIGA